jgi:hypothetical protein
MTEPVTQRELVLRRLADAWQLGSHDVSGNLWLAIVVPVLILGLIYVIWMYRRDSRTIAWPFAVTLGLLRTIVYLILAGVFLLPAWQTWETTQKRSRVIVLVDISPSMAEKSDDLPPDDGSQTKLQTRLDKVVRFLTDSQIAFLRTLCEKNPVYVYRFGARLDDEPVVFELGGQSWDADRWQQWLRLDAKRWLFDQVDEATRSAITKLPSFDVEKAGTPEWAAEWLKIPAADAVPSGLDDVQREKLHAVRARLDRRSEAHRQLLLGTDVGGSVLQALTKEAGNLPQGIVIMTDGRSNLGSEASLAEANARATKDLVPLFTVMVGEDRPVVEIRITDVQTPEQAPPNEKFVVRAELDGIGLPEMQANIYLDVYAPKADAPIHTFESRVTFQSGTPPHAIAEFALDPESAESLPAEMFAPGKKELVEGEWKFVVRVPRDKRETFAAKEHIALPVSVQVLKKPLRVLLVASGPTHDYQFLRTLLVRESDQKRAELSIFLQNEGRDGRAVQDVPGDRLLSRFPSTLTTEVDAEEKPEDRYYNLARYDAIIAYDPDWTEFTSEQLDLLKKWVDTQAGGLILVAGSVNTFQLARGEDGGRLKPLLDLFPVVPGDSVLLSGTGRKNSRTAWRLNFAGASPDMDFLKLDDDSKEPLAGWKQFFDGDGPAGQQPLRGFFGTYPVKAIKPGATVAASITDPSSRLPDGKEHPFLVTMPYGKGRVAFLGSSEMRRLRQYREMYYERFWMKLARWSAAGGRTRQNRRGVLVMGREFAAGSYVRIEAQLFGPTLEPLPRSARAKAIIASKDGSDRHEFEMTAKPGVADWAGWFQTRFIAPMPGDYTFELPIPNSGDILRGKFAVKAIDPELDNARPDPAALMQLASNFKDVEDRVPQGEARDAVRSRLRIAASTGDAEPSKLFFGLAGADVIPQCMTTQKKEQRNRGAYDDIWDDGPIFGRTADGKPIEVSAVLLVVVGLLSLEWLGRKLLRLA